MSAPLQWRTGPKGRLLTCSGVVHGSHDPVLRAGAPLEWRAPGRWRHSSLASLTLVW